MAGLDAAYHKDKLGIPFTITFHALGKYAAISWRKMTHEMSD
jgi:hypothetical protein